CRIRPGTWQRAPQRVLADGRLPCPLRHDRRHPCRSRCRARRRDCRSLRLPLRRQVRMVQPQRRAPLPRERPSARLRLASCALVKCHLTGAKVYEIRLRIAQHEQRSFPEPWQTTAKPSSPLSPAPARSFTCGASPGAPLTASPLTRRTASLRATRSRPSTSTALPTAISSSASPTPIARGSDTQCLSHSSL